MTDQEENRTITEEIRQDPTQPRKPIPYHLGDLLTEFDTFADMLDEAKRTKKPMGPVTGFDTLDRELCGCLLPGLHVLTGNTSAGKTAFCLQLASNCGCPALYVSCEVSALELLRRITARVTSTPLHFLKDPFAENAPTVAQMKEKVREAIKSAPGLVIADAIDCYADPDWIREMAANIKERSGSKHLLIVIDSLHTWANWLTGEEYERLNHSIGLLQQISAELNSAVLYISEQNRESNKQGNKAGVNSGAGNRRIEYLAETVFGLYDEVEGKSDDEGDKEDSFGDLAVKLKINKNRNGKKGKPLKLVFNGMFQSFREA